MTNHGDMLRLQARHSEAEAALLEARDILTAAFGPDHNRTRKVQEIMVKLHRD